MILLWLFLLSNGCFYSANGTFCGCLLLQVKTSGPKHTCGSVNNYGETIASNKWVANRVVDLLREQPEIGPRELQDRLKKKCCPVFFC
jgi:hypothetical protein